ncbi:hypothetical protein [Kitasatospora paranensis]|uniref:Uncharacterized protein n=1 Tax=Kitasatospora paranensis TaxID=258053 RepID=A0ABW2G083_9ACTN
MEQNEVLKRVIGILTQAGTWIHDLPAADDSDLDTEQGIVSDLLNDVMPVVAIPSNANAEEIASIVSEALGGRILQLTTAFAMAFWELAEVHDTGRTDLSSLDVLQALALRAETEPGA